MSLSERLNVAEQEAAKRAELAAMCPAGRMVAAMDETERVAFTKLLHTVASITRLSRILREEGYKHDRDTLILHLRGECICVSERSSG